MPVTSADEIDAWVRETAPQAIAYARSLLRNPHDAEDVVQGCYCRLLAKAHQYNLPNDGFKLLLRSISNATINLRTRQKTTRLIRTDGQSGEEEADDPVDRNAESPENKAIAGEASQLVQASLRKLPVQQRAAVELKSMGYPQTEIAEILGVTQSNAGVLIHRGRLALAELLSSLIGEEASS